MGAPNGLLRSLLEHLLELASESSEKRTNIKIMRDLQLVSKLLHIMVDISDFVTREILFTLLTILLGGQPRISDLLLFGQFMVSKLNSRLGESEKMIELRNYTKDSNTALEDADVYKQNVAVRNIVLRNRCLALLHSLLFTPRNTVNAIICDEISKVLGMDWLMLFMQSHVHSSTVIWSMRIMVVLCANETLIGRFREGTHNGGYLRHTELISQHKNTVVLAPPQMSSGPASPSAVGQTSTQSVPPQIAGEVKLAVLQISGFQYLEWLMPYHLEIPELYFLLTAFIMGQPVKLLGQEHTKLDLDRVWAFLWGAPVSHTPVGSIGPKVALCPEAVCVLLAMVRKIVHTDDNVEWLESHPVTIIQVLFSLYHNLPDFMPIIMLGDVVNSLAAILFPLENVDVGSEPNSGASTPDDGSHSKEIIPSQNSKEGKQLTSHSVRKFVIDLLRVIIVDSLSLSTTAKTAPVIDLVLDASPDNSDVAQQTTFQTEIITALMDHLLAADVLVGEQAALPIVPLLQSHVQNIAPNVFYVTARIVDKMWQGFLNKDPHEVRANY